MKKLLFIYLICLAGYTQAQQVYVQNQKSYSSDIFSKNFYSSERIMEMRDELDLSDAQAAKIKKIHSENAAEFSTLKWDLDEENRKLRAILDHSKIDQTAMQKQMDIVLNLENQLKKKQLNTMVSIKNVMTETQQKILDKPIVLTGTTTRSFTQNSANGVGKISGFDSGSGGKNSSVSVVVAGSNQPLYYLDVKGKMKQIESLKNINPNDIESMEVLKDNTAVEKFGEKGENGVIIIKLKENP